MTFEGAIPYSWPWNFWQTGRNPLPYNGASAAVESCISAISQSIAMMPVNHWRETDDGGRERVITSPAYRVMRRPNSYQTRSEFIVNLLRSELFQGNGYAQAVRDDRFQIRELHLGSPRIVSPYVDPEDGAIFYQFGFNPLVDGEQAFDPARYVPARDVLHVRLHTNRDPLCGETPLTAAMMAVAAGNSISAHTATFFQNMSRPSGVLSTKDAMAPEIRAENKASWKEATTGEQTGGTAILYGGLEWKPLTMTAVDSALIESYKLTVADIARVFRVPPAIIGELGGATFANTETLLRHWIATGLGYVIEHLEQSFDYLFRLPESEWIEFDTDYLLRSEFAARIDALTKGITGGLFAPNEARAREGLPKVDGGDEPFVQQQLQRISDRAENIPLDAGREPAPAPAAPPPPAAPAADPAPPSADEQAAFAEFLERIIHPVDADATD